MNRGLSRVALLRTARRARGKGCCDPSPPRERSCSQPERGEHPKSGPRARFHRSEGPAAYRQPTPYGCEWPFLSYAVALIGVAR